MRLSIRVLFTCISPLEEVESLQLTVIYISPFSLFDLCVPLLSIYFSLKRFDFASQLAS